MVLRNCNPVAHMYGAVVFTVQLMSPVQHVLSKKHMFGARRSNMGACTELDMVRRLEKKDAVS